MNQESGKESNNGCITYFGIAAVVAFILFGIALVAGPIASVFYVIFGGR
ncbi:MAG: hypothetical protein AB7G44_00905 [Bacteroidia bacterium]